MPPNGEEEEEMVSEAVPLAGRRGEQPGAATAAVAAAAAAAMGALVVRGEPEAAEAPLDATAGEAAANGNTPRAFFLQELVIVASDLARALCSALATLVLAVPFAVAG